MGAGDMLTACSSLARTDPKHATKLPSSCKAELLFRAGRPRRYANTIASIAKFRNFSERSKSSKRSNLHRFDASPHAVPPLQSGKASLR